MHESSGQEEGSGAPLGPDEREELEQLRAEVSELRDGTAGRPRRGAAGWWRPPVAIVLITIGCLLAPLSVLAVWTANQVSDTNRYVANMTPLISEPAVQHALADKITTVIVDELDIQQLSQQAATALSGRGLTRAGNLLNSLSGPLESAATGFIHTQVARVLASPLIASLWVQLNMTAHQQLVKLMSGQGGGTVTVSGDQVTISLGPFIKAVQTSLTDQGFTLASQLPPVNPSVTLFTGTDLSRAQAAYRLINDLKVALPVAMLLFLALGVYAAKSRRRGLVGASLGLAAAMFALGAGLAIARTVYLRSVPSDVLPGDAAAALFDTLVRFIRDGLRLVAVIGILIAVGAFFTGPAATAVRTRAALASGAGRLRQARPVTVLRGSPSGQWVARHRGVLIASSATAAALIFVFWPALSVAIVLALLLLLVLGVIALAGQPTEAEAESGAPAAPAS